MNTKLLVKYGRNPQFTITIVFALALRADAAQLSTNKPNPSQLSSIPPPTPKHIHRYNSRHRHNSTITTWFRYSLFPIVNK
jgi:hypothetical protein